VRGYLYATKDEDLKTRLQLCKQALTAFMETSKDVKRKDTAKHLQETLAWHYRLIKGSKKYSEIAYKDSYYNNKLIVAAGRPITPFWRDAFTQVLNTYCIHPEVLQRFIRLSIRQDKDNVKALIHKLKYPRHHKGN